MAESGSGHLADQRCVPCRGGTPALNGEELERFAAQLPQWKVVAEHHLARSFSFPDFKEALAFVNRIGEGHHPDICLSWGKTDVTIFTHKIKGLSESDFILAAKIDRLFGHC